MEGLEGRFELEILTYRTISKTTGSGTRNCSNETELVWILPITQHGLEGLIILMSMLRVLGGWPVFTRYAADFSSLQVEIQRLGSA